MAKPGIRYDVSITGIDDRELRAELEAVSNTFALKEQAPATMNLLRDNYRLVLKEYTKSLGERDPVASNETAEGRRLNLRVEITIINWKNLV